jgi:chaperonin cofactor prefoldin
MKQELTEIDKAVNELNKIAAPTPKIEKPGYDFVEIGQRLMDSLLEAAQQNFNLAETDLEKTRRYVEELKLAIQKKNAELADMQQRLSAYGKTLLDAHQTFHNGGGQQ